MISFNFDYITNNLYKNKVRTEKNQPVILVNFYNTLILLIKKTEKKLLRTAFLLAFANPPTKIQKLEIIQPIIRRKLEAAFLNITRYSFMRHKKQTIPKQKQYNYPLSILSKIVSLKRAELLQQGFVKLRLNRRNKVRYQKILLKIPQFLLDYLRKNIYPKGFRGIKSASSKSKEYAKHIKYFQYIFQSIRMRKQFDSFTLLGIKTSQKMIAELQKDKGQKRVMANQKGVKRTEVINELKRKLYNMKAQVNEGQILNDKKKVDGTKQNGQKLIKKNEEMRIIEINTSYLQYDVYNLQKQLIRKQDFIQSRAGNKMKFQQLKKIYEYIRNVVTAKDGKLIYSKLVPVSKVKEIENKNSYIITQNVKLKHLMSLYEKVGENRKTDSYNNAQNQNSSLKMLIASLFKVKFMEPQRQAIVESCHQIQEKLSGLNDERQKLKSL